MGFFLEIPIELANLPILAKIPNILAKMKNKNVDAK